MSAVSVVSFSGAAWSSESISRRLCCGAPLPPCARGSKDGPPPATPPWGRWPGPIEPVEAAIVVGTQEGPDLCPRLCGVLWRMDGHRPAACGAPCHFHEGHGGRHSCRGCYGGPPPPAASLRESADASAKVAQQEQELEQERVAALGARGLTVVEKAFDAEFPLVALSLELQLRMASLDETMARRALQHPSR